MVRKAESFEGQAPQAAFRDAPSTSVGLAYPSAPPDSSTLVAWVCCDYESGLFFSRAATIFAAAAVATSCVKPAFTMPAINSSRVGRR